MKKVIMIIVFLVILLSGAFFWITNARKTSPALKSETTTQKSGTSSKTGTITASNGVFYLTVTGQPAIELDSYAINLEDYLGKTVMVSGQYSGDTLFVGSIEVK